MRKSVLAFLSVLFLLPPPAPAAEEPVETGGKRVYILPVRDDIMPPMVYLVRRGVKEAMEAGADLLVLDMDTNGGRGDSMMEIIEILDNFPGEKVTFVNKKAFSAGALISFATGKIFMAPGAVIGAAAPVMMSPGGAGAQDMPNTLEAKSASAISALIRVQAEKYGHNKDVVDAMIRKTRELKLEGEEINKEGEVLTLNNTEAERKYGDPPRPLLSSGTVEDLDALLAELGFAEARRQSVVPTGAEEIARWINALNWLWLIIGIAGIYVEFKTPGFGLPGIIGVCAFALYFLGGYVAALSGLEWAALFIVGLILVILELFVFQGTVVLGIAGAMLMLMTLIMAMVDMYPGMPMVPTWPQLRVPVRDVGYAFLGSFLAVAALAKLLPKTSIYSVLVSQSTSGMESTREVQTAQSHRLGREGIALSVLRPSGKARFGDEVLDVMTQGDLIERDARVRIINHSSHAAIVEPL